MWRRGRVKDILRDGKRGGERGRNKRGGERKEKPYKDLVIKVKVRKMLGKFLRMCHS